MAPQSVVALHKAKGHINAYNYRILCHGSNTTKVLCADSCAHLEAVKADHTGHKEYGTHAIDEQSTTTSCFDQDYHIARHRSHRRMPRGSSRRFLSSTFVWLKQSTSPHLISAPGRQVSRLGEPAPPPGHDMLDGVVLHSQREAPSVKDRPVAVATACAPFLLFCFIQGGGLHQHQRGLLRKRHAHMLIKAQNLQTALAFDTVLFAAVSIAFVCFVLECPVH